MRRRGVLVAARRAPAAHRCPGSLRVGPVAGSQPRGHGEHGGNALGAASRRHRRRRRHDIDERRGHLEYSTDLRSRPRHRRRGPRRAGGHRRCACRPAHLADPQPVLPQDQQLLVPGHGHRHDLRRPHAGPNLRRCGCGDLATVVADSRRRRGQRQRQRASRRAGRNQSAVPVQVRHRPPGRPRRHLQRQCQRAQGRHRVRLAALSDLHQ